MEKYVISYLSGSKALKTESFDFKKKELTIGRDADNDIRFSPEQDSMVSRKHAKIDKTAPYLFKIVDLASKNGVYVNDRKVDSEEPLTVGDKVTLGVNGPSFVFDILPRPQQLMPATQVIDITPLPATSVLDADTAVNEPPKAGVGQQTVERMIHTQQKKTNSKWILAISTLSAITLATVYFNKDKLVSHNTVFIDSTKTIYQENTTPSWEAIQKQNQDKVVFIEFGFKLIHTPSGEDIYHQYFPYQLNSKETVYLPAYIQLPSGKIEPFLGLKKDSSPASKPIAVAGYSGSGFVVSSQGHILTNKHVAASWTSAFQFPDDAFPGILFVETDKGYAVGGLIKELNDWVPADTEFFGQKPASGKIIEGENTYLDITFNNNSQRFPAAGKPIISDKHDVAMIKIDIPEALAPVELYDANDDAAAGQEIMVMGYPAIAGGSTYEISDSRDMLTSGRVIKEIPSVTSTPGSIGKVVKSSSGTFTTGDYYQLTVNATGGGNSGGPVFNRQGQVIGIFYAKKWDQVGTSISYAVPIKYGLEIMGRKIVN